MPVSNDMPSRSVSQRKGVMRPAVEFFVCLAVLVTLFRTFEAESYMIETGSMAPCLLGYHRRVVCPSCRYPFRSEDGHASARAVCPNCGQAGIGVAELVRNDGDQLLVQRGTYEFKAQRRWEVVVFRNPGKQTQAYVKRLVALPGESVQIVEGDIHIDGQIQTKDLATQRSMRIPVYDHDYRPPDEDHDWRPRWVAEAADGRWKAAEGGFLFTGLGATGSNAAAPAAVRYRHWVRHGGTHATSVRLSRWPSTVDSLKPDGDTLRFDPGKRVLICRGCMPGDLLDRLLSQSGDAEFVEAIDRLYEASHIAPVTDVYGYNRSPDSGGQNEVRDLMLALNLSLRGGAGRFSLGISDGSEEFVCQFDFSERKIRLTAGKSGAVVRTGVMPGRLVSETALVELSLMDRQVLLAIDGELVFKPWQYAAPPVRGPTPWKPAWFAASDLNLQVSGLKLYRDVYYTAGEGRRGFDAPFQLRSGEFFALGDNSPVSRDSRSWPAGKMLTEEMFQGKPFLVHLPSRKRRIQLGGWQADIRIPELSRVRYIR